MLSIRTGTYHAMLAAAVWCLAPAAALAPLASPEPLAPPAPPRLQMQALERTAPGWTEVETTGDAKTGHLQTERIVWPLFYLHWKPLSGPGGVGDKVSVAEAGRVVTSLWEGLTFDAPPQGRKVALPGHEAVELEATTSHGEWKSRYLVWACPESGRLFIAEASVSLVASAPPALFELMSLMARSVRCHPDVKVEETERLAKKRTIPSTDISYWIPHTWAPVAGYRVQKVFSEGQFSAADHAAPTQQQGQDVVVELDAVRRLQVTWGPAPDAAMTFDTLIQDVHAFWKDRATNMLPAGTRVSNDVWIMDGLVRYPQVNSVPPSRMHKFRAWIWRKNGMSYMAVGELGGVRFGQRVMTEIQDLADPMLEEMYQSVDY